MTHEADAIVPDDENDRNIYPRIYKYTEGDLDLRFTVSEKGVFYIKGEYVNANLLFYREAWPDWIVLGRYNASFTAVEDEQFFDDVTRYLYKEEDEQAFLQNFWESTKVIAIQEPPVIICKIKSQPNETSPEIRHQNYSYVIMPDGLVFAFIGVRNEDNYNYIGDMIREPVDYVMLGLTTIYDLATRQEGRSDDQLRLLGLFKDGKLIRDDKYIKSFQEIEEALSNHKGKNLLLDENIKLIFDMYNEYISEPRR